MLLLAGCGGGAAVGSSSPTPTAPSPRQQLALYLTAFQKNNTSIWSNNRVASIAADRTKALGLFQSGGKGAARPKTQ